MKHNTLHISFPIGETDLYHEIMQEHEATLIPVATIVRRDLKKARRK